MSGDDSRQIVFFDGVCGLCNNFVDFVMPRDTKKKLRFSPLQSETALTTLPQELTQDLSTIVFYDAGAVYVRSEAVLRALGYLGPLWASLQVLLVIPGFLRDGVYNWIAKNRYKWFGEKETCRLPTPEERERFI